MQFAPVDEFIEYVKAIPVSELPKNVNEYIHLLYKDAKITEAVKVADAHGKTFYEAEVKKRDIVFDEAGNFVKADD